MTSHGIPPNNDLFLAPWLTAWISRCTVVKDTTVCRPSKRPVKEVAIPVSLLSRRFDRFSILLDRSQNKSSFRLKWFHHLLRRQSLSLVFLFSGSYPLISLATTSISGDSWYHNSKSSA